MEIEIARIKRSHDTWPCNMYVQPSAQETKQTPLKWAVFVDMCSGHSRAIDLHKTRAVKSMVAIVLHGGLCCRQYSSPFFYEELPYLVTVDRRALYDPLRSDVLKLQTALVHSKGGSPTSESRTLMSVGQTDFSGTFSTVTPWICDAVARYCR